MKNDTHRYRVIERERLIEFSRQDTLQNNVNIYEEALRSLFYDGFNLYSEGTQYLASLIAQFFHERESYARIGFRKDYKSYWDLSNPDNEHYAVLGDSTTNVISAINKAIEESEWEEGPIDDLVYTITDNIIHRYDRDKVLESGTDFIKYSNILRKNRRRKKGWSPNRR